MGDTSLLPNFLLRRACLEEQPCPKDSWGPKASWDTVSPGRPAETGAKRNWGPTACRPARRLCTRAVNRETGLCSGNACQCEERYVTNKEMSNIV